MAKLLIFDAFAAWSFSRFEVVQVFYRSSCIWPLKAEYKLEFQVCFRGGLRSISFRSVDVVMEHFVDLPSDQLAFVHLEDDYELILAAVLCNDDVEGGADAVETFLNLDIRHTWTLVAYHEAS